MKRLCGLVALVLFSGFTGQARSDSMYWSDQVGGDIVRANLDGTSQTTLVSGLRGPLLGPALDPVHGLMYWADTFDGDIRRASLDGTGQTTLIRGLLCLGGPF
jgi:hypothetical protein